MTELSTQIPSVPDRRLRGSERRAWVRHASNLEANCGRIADGTDPRFPGKLCDISAGGIALLLRRCFQPGTVLVVKVKARGAGAPSVLFARVVHVRQHGRVEWFTGCAFASPLDEEELQALLV